ncbi:hypothetical protein AUJ63_01765 [Candidatus Pacearchaeota archaeon CG1_02_35_32]|nr:MAG: hypothetical protein AUJ63_01765 [Candidatus Pacearchaeota archaeon CG1_02_35_32]
MKNLELKKVSIAVVWNGLKSTPPKEFPTIGEIESASKVLDKLKETIPEFVKIIEEGEAIGNEIMSGKMTPELQKRREEYLKKTIEIENKHGKEIVKIELEDEEFNAFFQQCERWSKNWFNRIDGLLDFRKELNKANSAPKGKK